MTALDTIKQAVLGAPEPSRQGVVKAFSEMQLQLEGAQAGAYIRSTKTSLNALLLASVAAMAWVVNDPTQANNGIYENTGTASAAVWTRRADIPVFFITGINEGEGTADAIEVTTDLPVPSQDGRAIIGIPILAANTISPPTVQLNGAGPFLPIISNTGENVAIGGLQPNMLICGFVTAGKFRMITSQVDDAIVAQAENAAADAADAAADAIAAMSAVQTTLPSRAFAIASFHPAVAPAYLRTGGYYNPGDAGGAFHIKVNSEPSHAGKFSITLSDGVTIAWYELAYTGLTNPEVFGAKRDNMQDDGPKWNDAIDFTSVKGGGEIIGLPGIYRVATRINLKSKVKLRSAIRHASTLQAATSVSGAHIIFADQGQTQIAVEDFSIIGNYAGSGQSDHGILIFNCAYVNIRGNLLTNITGSAIIINGAFGLPITDVRVTDNIIVGAYWGITCFKNVIDCIIANNRVDNCRNHGILVDDATSADSASNPNPLFRPASNYRVQIVNNIITTCATSNTGSGIAWSSSFGGIISGNNISVIGVSGAGGAVGIVVNSGQAWFAPAADIIISNNAINTIYMGPGIQISGGQRIAVNGNVIHSCGLGGSASSTSVIQVLNDDVTSGQHSTSISITGNEIIGTAQATVGVYVSAGSLNVNIGANGFVGLTTDVKNDDTNGSNQISFIGGGTLPTHMAGWGRRVWVDNSAIMWVNNTSAWVKVGTQT